MKWESLSHSFLKALPLISFVISEWEIWRVEQIMPCYHLAAMPQGDSELLPYPLDMWPLLALPLGPLDEKGVPFVAEEPSGYYATTIAQYALANWNAYLSKGDEKYKRSFMIQANWLVEHESRLSDDADGWPCPIPLPEYNAPSPWLSALIQGNCISVLVRAYRLTGEGFFLQVARRAIRTFELDILDGGVSTSIGDNGVFFEEVAAYPAAHVLNGYFFALFGLYDYVALTGDAQIVSLIQRSLLTLHILFDYYDTGYWSRYDLLHRHPATHFYHALHITMLEALARNSNCQHCLTLAAHWAAYQHSLRCRLQYLVVRCFVRYRHGLRQAGIRGAFTRILRPQKQTRSESVSVPNSVTPIERSGSGVEVPQ